MPKKTRNQISLSLDEVHNHNVCIDDRDIFLHSFINGEEDPGIDYRSANKFLKNIQFLENINSNPILIHMNSLGGDWESGMVIYDSILACKSPIIILVQGCAYSLGSIILQAADKRVMMPNSRLMIHEGSNIIEGSTKQTVSFANVLKSINEFTLDIFSDVCREGKFFKENKHTVGQIKKYIQDKMDQADDWYITPKEGVSLGLIDGIYGEKEFASIEELKS